MQEQITSSYNFLLETPQIKKKKLNPTKQRKEKTTRHQTKASHGEKRNI
jgi:hypothetical protein